MSTLFWLRPRVNKQPEQSSLAEAARAILLCADPLKKATLARETATAWQVGDIATIGTSCAPDAPAQPANPVLLLPKDMPRRRAGGQKQNRIALLHAVAHIELNAINLAWDIISRFASDNLPREFFDDWVQVGDEEAKHFLLINDRLSALGAQYGELPAHDGLWHAAKDTAHSLTARLAIVPLVFEARGLDVTPPMIDKFTRVGDSESAACLNVIYQDEIGHVSIGKKWFDWACARHDQEPITTWRRLVNKHFAGKLKPPFNHKARLQANFTEDYYLMESEPGNEYEKTAQLIT